MDDPIFQFLRRMQRAAELRAAHTGPEPPDMDAISKQVTEDLAKEDREAVYYPAESERGRELRDRVLAIQDLLAVIFVHCLPDMYEDRLMYPSPCRAPMLLAQVCRYWRHVALSTPSLWSSFPLYEGFDTRLFDLWVERSAAVPLSLRADKETITSVLPLCSRLQNITLDLDSYSLSVLNSMKNNLPLLRTLFVQLPKHEFIDEPPAFPPCDAFENAPNLRMLCLKRPSCDFRIPFSQLTDLEIYGALGAEYVLRCCQDASNLAFLCVGIGAPPSQPSTIDTTTCNLVNLKFLQLDEGYFVHSPEGLVAGPCQLRPLLDKLNCPILEELTLSNMTCHDSFKVPGKSHAMLEDSIISFLERSPLITQLTIDIRLKYDKKLVSLFERLPALEQLQIRHIGIIFTAFCERLTYHPESAAAPTPLCPRLRVLDVGHLHGLQSPPALVKMIASRRHVVKGAPVVRLEKLVMNCEDDECAIQLRQLADEGLDLELSTGKPNRESKRKRDPQVEEDVGCRSQ